MVRNAATATIMTSDVVEISFPSQNFNISSDAILSVGPGITGAMAPIMPTKAEKTAMITSRMSIIFIVSAGKVSV